MDCTGCEFPLTESEKLATTQPPLCTICEDNRCFWCGEYVAPVDKAKDGNGVCHKACYTEMYTEDLETLAPDLEDAGIPEEDNPGSTDPEDLETPF